MTIYHCFEDSLLASHEVTKWPGWEALYKAAFAPRFKALLDFPEDGPHQRAGVDRMVVTTTADVILIDEKVRGRSRSGHVFDDIFLEIVDDVERGTPGWAVKPLRAHFIAYLIAPLGKLYLLPTLQLQSAWQKNATWWSDRFGVKRVFNRDRRSGHVYYGECCPVPVADLFGAIGGNLRLDFQPFEFDVESCRRPESDTNGDL